MSSREIGNMVEDTPLPKRFSTTQELACWLLGDVLVVFLFDNSHTFNVIPETYWWGLALVVVIAFLCWMRFRKRMSIAPRWLRILGNVSLVFVGAIFLIYLLGVVTYYE